MRIMWFAWALVAGCSPQDEAPAEHVDDPRDSEIDALDVEGLVVDGDGRALGERAVRVVDARGEHRAARSDGEGHFRVAAVTPPYDVVIASDAVLGISERAPRVSVGKTTATLAAIEHVRVTVKPPPCIAPPCWLSVATRSSRGRGAVSMGYEDDAARDVRVAHALSRLRAAGDDEIEVHALTGDASRQAFAYAGGRGGDVLAPAAVSGTRAVIAEVNAPSLSDEWTFATTVSLEVRGAIFDLAGADGRMVVAHVPVLDGATVRARTLGLLSPFGERAEWQRSVEGRATRDARAAGGVDRMILGVTPGPELLVPTGATEMSSTTGTFEWSALESPAWATLEVTDMAADEVVLRVRTRGRGVSLVQLRALGLPELALGPHLIELSTNLPSGTVATQRVPVTVTP